MKILQINVSQNGSTGHIAQSIHNRLLRDGDESLFLYARGEMPIQTRSSLVRNAMLSRATGKVGGFCKKETNDILQRIETFQPDCVHLHNIHGYYVNIFTLLDYLKSNNIPTVLTLHDEFMYTGRCAFTGECVNWYKGCGDCPDMQVYPAAWMDRSKALLEQKKTLFDGFDSVSIVCPSRWLAHRAKSTFLKARGVSVIPNGIETDLFCPGKSSIRDLLNIREEKIALAAAQDLMLERKGGAHVTALAAIMPNVRFILVGADVDNFPDNVTVLPDTLSPAEMASLYRGSDAFIIASREDNFPTVCLEAAACGTPVAGFDSGGTKETVSEKISRFVPYGDLDALKHATEKMFELTDKTANSAYAKTAEEMYAQYRALYEAKI